MKKKHKYTRKKWNKMVREGKINAFTRADNYN